MRGQLELKTSPQLQYAAFFIQGSVWPQLQEQFPHKNCFGNVSGDLIQNCSCCQKSPVYALKMRHACTWIIPCKLILVQLFVLKTNFFEQFVCFKDFPRLFYLWFSINRTTFCNCFFETITFLFVDRLLCSKVHSLIADIMPLLLLPLPAHLDCVLRHACNNWVKFFFENALLYKFTRYCWLTLLTRDESFSNLANVTLKHRIRNNYLSSRTDDENIMNSVGVL